MGLYLILIIKWWQIQFNFPNTVKMWNLYCTSNQCQCFDFLTFRTILGRKSTLQAGFLTFWQCGMVAKKVLWRQSWFRLPAPSFLCVVTLDRLCYGMSFSAHFVCVYVMGTSEISPFPFWQPNQEDGDLQSSTKYLLSPHQVNIWKLPFYCMTSILKCLALYFIFSGVQSLQSGTQVILTFYTP